MFQATSNPKWECRSCGRAIPINNNEKEFLCAMCFWQCRKCGRSIPRNNQEKTFLCAMCTIDVRNNIAFIPMAGAKF